MVYSKQDCNEHESIDAICSWHCEKAQLLMFYEFELVPLLHNLVLFNSLWCQLFKWIWYISFTFISSSISTPGRLQVYHLSSHWKLHQRNYNDVGYSLSKDWVNFRLRWIEGWPNCGLISDWKILWKYEQYPSVYSNISKSPDDKVGALSHAFHQMKWCLD